jgi:hypothetical protein
MIPLRFMSAALPDDGGLSRRLVSMRLSTSQNALALNGLGPEHAIAADILSFRRN